MFKETASASPPNRLGDWTNAGWVVFACLLFTRWLVAQSPIPGEMVTPNDPYFPVQWALKNTRQFGGVPGMDMNATAAWMISKGDPLIKIVIIDVGVDQVHEDINQDPGFDATGQGGEGGPVNAYDKHGTALAGCVSAKINNNLGVVGICPDCRSVSARTGESLDDQRHFFAEPAFVIDTLIWAESIGARLTNTSLAFPASLQTPEITQMFVDTRFRGMVHFAASGGDGAPTLAYPASLSCVNAVGAIDVNGNRWHESNYGAELDFVAPGANISTTDWTGLQGYVSGEYVLGQLSGASFASAYAAGVAGLILSQNPNLNAAQVEWIMQCTARYLPTSGELPSSAGNIPRRNTEYGWGLINANSALQFPTRRVSVDEAIVQGNNSSQRASISADGRFVTFESSASNLVQADLNSVQDIFVHDRHTAKTARLSESSGGTEAAVFSASASISGNGRFVAFQSQAPSLVPNDVGAVDVFVRDRDHDMNGVFDETGVPDAVETQLISVNSSGLQVVGASSVSPSISYDGRFVAFSSNGNLDPPETTPNDFDVFVRDRSTGTTKRVSVSTSNSEGNGTSREPIISSNGLFVAFESAATNLLPLGEDTNGAFDILVRDRTANTTTRASVASGGGQSNGASYNASISGDPNARYVAFESVATNLAPEGDANSASDVFVHDRQDGTTVRVSTGSAGGEGNGGSFRPSISYDGRYVAFESLASNLVPDDTNGTSDIFIHDRDADEDGIFDEPGAVMTTRISLDSLDAQADGASFTPSMSPDARYVAFHSDASNLTPMSHPVLADTNAVTDVFLYQCTAPCVPPLILEHPVGDHVCKGQFVRLTVTADGTPPPSYQWRKNGAPIFDAIFPAYSIDVVTPSDTGQYDVLIRNRCGSLTSNPGTLVVGTPAPASYDFDCDGDVDLEDFGAHLGCQTGPAGIALPGCVPFDRDGDGDIDLWDFAAFQIDFGW